MMRPSATAPVSFTMCFSSLPLDSPLVRVGDTCAVSPSSRAIPPMRSAWYGSLTRITSEQAAFAQDARGRGERLPRVRPLHLAQDLVVGHAAFQEVVRARGRLGEPIAGPLAAGHDDDRREALLPQIERVVEPGGQHGRRPPVVLRGAEHDDRVGSLRAVVARCEPHLHERDPDVEGEEAEDRSERDRDPPDPSAPRSRLLRGGRDDRRRSSDLRGVRGQHASAPTCARDRARRATRTAAGRRCDRSPRHGRALAPCRA